MTVVEPDVDISTSDTTSTDEEDGKHAHIVYGKADVTKAYIEGTPVIALCGYTWVPSKDPNNLPVCQKCLDIRKGIADANKNHES